MVRSGIITRLRAAQALERMLEHGSRLPQDECKRRIREWTT